MSLALNIHLFKVVPIHLQEENMRLMAKFTNAFKDDPFKSLAGLLDSRGLLTDRFSVLVLECFFFSLQSLLALNSPSFILFV